MVYRAMVINTCRTSVAIYTKALASRPKPCGARDHPCLRTLLSAVLRARNDMFLEGGTSAVWITDGPLRTGGRVVTAVGSVGRLRD